jgi:hypothetical protein
LTPLCLGFQRCFEEEKEREKVKNKNTTHGKRSLSLSPSPRERSLAFKKREFRAVYRPLNSFVAFVKGKDKKAVTSERAERESDEK